MTVYIATQDDLADWVRLRACLWDDTPAALHHREASEILSRTPEAAAVFLEREAGSVRGFAEAALRTDHVNGCETSPVAFLEGIFVDAACRGTGIGADLLAAVQTWARDRGCTELASDAYLENTDSHAFHRALGFDETQRVVYFRKPL